MENFKKVKVFRKNPASRKASSQPAWVPLTKSELNPTRKQVREALQHSQPIVFKAPGQDVQLIPDRIACYDPEHHEVVIRGCLVNDPRQRVVVLYATSGSGLARSSTAGNVRFVPPPTLH